MKKRRSICFLLVFVILILETMPVSAATVTFNKWFRGNTKGTQKMMYTFKMPANGYFYYEVEPVGEYYLHNGNKFNMGESIFVHASMMVNYKYYDNNVKAYYGKGFKSSCYAFKKGTTVKISVFDGEGYETPFRIRVVYKKVVYFESENNNSKSEADSVKMNSYARGVLMENDIDWFKIKIPSTGRYRVSFVATNDDTDHSVVTRCWIKDKLEDTHSFWSGDGSSVILNKKLKKNTIIYVKAYDAKKGTFYKVSVKKVS